LDHEINITNQMQGKKIIYKKGYLDNHIYGNNNNNENIFEEMNINSDFNNPYYKVELSPTKIKLIK
jgi:hypothetical protein